jgi:heptaprenylglyceryl phosphate synthase
MVILEVGYTKYVLSAKDAVTVMDILNGAEVYQEKYISEANSPTGKSHTLHHVYDQGDADMRRISLWAIPDSLYKMAKLAGRPE